MGQITHYLTICAHIIPQSPTNVKNQLDIRQEF